MNVTHLSDRTVLKIKGENSIELLHNVITKDLKKIKPYATHLTAMLDLKGKVIVEFFVTVVNNVEDKIIIDIHDKYIDTFMEQMKKYTFRHPNIIIKKVRHLSVWYGSNDNYALNKAIIVYKDPRCDELEHRYILKDAENYGTESETNEYKEFLFEHGVVDLAYVTDEPCNALYLNYKEMNGIDWNKGCYIGQEIMSRMAHRDKITKRYIPVYFNDVAGREELLLQDKVEGLPIYNTEKELVGHCAKSVLENGLFALLSVAKISDEQMLYIDLGNGKMVDIEVKIPDILKNIFDEITE